MARVGRCQSVIIGNKTYYYGETVPYICWKVDDIKNEMWNARITAVSGIRENNVSFDGRNGDGNLISTTIDMNNIVDV